jgi:hypothetical protein
MQFTARQLDMELALLLGDFHCKLVDVLGEERAALAFRFPVTHCAKWEFLPEEIPIDEFPIHEEAHQLAEFAQRGTPFGSVESTLRSLELLSFWITPDLVEYWAGAKTLWPEFHEKGETPTSQSFDEIIDEPLAVGIHYLGIIKWLIQVGSARLKLDRGEALTLGELAALVSFNERTVMSSASRGEIETEQRDGRRWVSADHARPWLLARGYVETKNPTKSASINGPDTETAGQREHVFVPVARDGTFFSPDCFSGGGYTIGPKESERKYLDYFEALAALAKMPTPRWRRPNGKGNRGIVSGTQWHRMPKQTLVELLSKRGRAPRSKSNEAET